jgi:hypothetical protein
VRVADVAQRRAFHEVEQKLLDLPNTLVIDHVQLPSSLITEPGSTSWHCDDHYGEITKTALRKMIYHLAGDPGGGPTIRGICYCATPVKNHSYE